MTPQDGPGEPDRQGWREVLTPITYEEFRALPFADRFKRRTASYRSRASWQGSSAYRQLRAVLRTGAFPCEECGSRENIEIDHMKAIILGGLHHLGNLRAVCRGCHARKKGF